LKFEYLLEFEPEFEKVLGCELGAHMGLIHEKNQRPKISCYCTFKAGYIMKYKNWISIHLYLPFDKNRTGIALKKCEYSRLSYA
jgi:hypothetical protein